MSKRRPDAKKLREGIEESFRRNFGKGGERYCPNDHTEIIYGGLRPEHAPPYPFTSARAELGGRTYARNGVWKEGGYCANCNFVTERPVQGERLIELQKRFETTLVR